MAAAGSDTTQGLMTLLQQQGYGTATTPFYNIPANFTLAGAATFTVPGQNNTSCPTDTIWSQDPSAPASNTAPTRGVAPFGSTAGKKYLDAEDTGTGPNPNAANGGGTTPTGQGYGCVNVARSSSGPGSLSATGATDRSGFEYYAYALDAVSWASSSTRSPATLTQAQLVGIYNCTFTDWSQVGGAPGPIVRYFPQPGSGTRSFFISDILGQPSSYDPATFTSCPIHLIEENEGQQVLASDTDSAIMPYSAAVWDLQQSNSINPSLDRRVNTVGSMQILHGITTAPASGSPVTAVPVHWNGSNHDYELDSTTQVVESNVKVNLPSGTTPAFPGIRYVYNILDSTLTGNNNYAAASSLFGFDNSSAGATTKSPMCSNTGSSNNQQIALGSIQSAGFASLNTTGNFNGDNVSGSTCRLLKPAP